MKTPTYNKKEQGSITLGVVFGLGLLSMTLAGIALNAVTNTVGAHRNEVAGLRTFVTADAAAREGVHRFLHTDNFTGDADWASLAGGNDMNAVLGSAITVDYSTWPNIRVRGNAENALAGREAGITVTLSDLEAGFDHAIYSQFDLEMGGNATVNGSVYANGDIDFDGTSAQVNGNVYAAGEIDTSHDNIGETFITVKNTKIIHAPEIISAPYSIQATADLTLYTNPVLAQNAHKGVTTNNKVIYVAGASNSTKLENANTKISGTVFVEGDLSLKGVTITPGNDADHSDPLVVYVGGDLHLAGNTTIHGLVYVEGETTFAGGNNTITGSLMSANGVSQMDVTGNITVHYDPALMAKWKTIGGLTFTPGVDDVARVSGWSQN
jgi:hypothetical protein